MSKHHQCWNKMHVAIVKTPPTTSCISRLDRERILIAKKTNHHPYLLFLYFSCFSHLKRTKHRKHSFVRSANYTPEWQARPPSDLSHQETYIREYMCNHVPNSLTLLTHGVQTGLVAVGLPLPNPLGPKKKKDSYKLPYQVYKVREYIWWNQFCPISEVCFLGPLLKASPGDEVRYSITKS